MKRGDVFLVAVGLALLLSVHATANEEISVALPGGTKMEFVWIDPGTFLMGSPDSDLQRYSWESPQHSVTITKGFYLGKFEVTQTQWQGVTGYNHSRFQGPNRPVEQVNWFGVHEYIHLLNLAEGDSLYRLPTEAEWEYACRAGTTTRWSFGDDESEAGKYAWFDCGFPCETVDVGTKLPNPWGLYDMHGNVSEWVEDWISDYEIGPATDPSGPLTPPYPYGLLRVFRGGKANDRHALYLRSASRGDIEPATNTWQIGVRIVRVASKTTAISPQSWGKIKGSVR